MKKARSVRHVFEGIPTIEGAGVHLNRYFGSDTTTLFDPFLLLDDFSASRKSDYIKGFPWHPHRGIDTITYVLEGSVEHGDSLGNSGAISPGEVQWMTAGSGIIHQEMPLGNEHERMSGFQLWANIPAEHKMTDPLYQNIGVHDIPQVHLSDRSVYRIIAGSFDNKQGPIQNRYIDPVYFDISLPPDTEFVYPTPAGHTFFVYLFEGEAAFGTVDDDGGALLKKSAKEDTGPQDLPLMSKKQVLLFSAGDFITVSTRRAGARFLLIGGRPLHEPIAWYGPIVMNTEVQLQTAFEEFQIGTFIKHGKHHGSAPKPVVH